MGWFSSSIAELSIDFYSEFVFESEVTCVLNGDKLPEKVFNYFILYYSKVRSNVGRYNPLFNVLEVELRREVASINKSYDPLKSSNKLKDECNERPVVTCSANFLTNNGITTKFKGPDLEMFSVISVRVFLKYIIATLSEEELKTFLLALYLFLRDLPEYF